jgi:hypothetical protein
MSPLRLLKPGIAVAAIWLIAGTMLTLEASARGPGGGGHGGGSHGGGRMGGAGLGGAHGGGGHGGRIGGLGLRGGHGGVAGRPLSASHHVGRAGIGSRSITGNHSVEQSSSARIGARGAAVGAGNRLGAASARMNTPGSLRHTANVTRAHAVFGKRAISNAALRSASTPFRFHGRFPGSAWPWWRGGIVIGWIGPVFWPYAYYDFFDYVFWPYGYDDFWPYAYDDIYYGVYGPYALPTYGPAGYVDTSAAPPPPLRSARTQNPAIRAAEVCSNQASVLTDWPIQRISELVQPTDSQRPALDEFKLESAKAIDLLKANCPNDLPSIPTGRLAAMETRLETMLTAVRTVRPALDRFYQSLNDEQKARFNVVSTQESSSVKDERALTALCDARGPGVTDLPIERIAAAVQPTEAQRAALDALREASMNAATSLKTDCPTYKMLTPVGRVEAMEQRLTGTLAAVKTVQPALTKFYDELSDEQKARFNALRTVDHRSQG